MHERRTHDTSNCSIARTLEVVGEKWTILILREALYGVRRFDDFEAVLHCPRNLLSERLRKLVDEGILSAEWYQEPGHRRRREYVLTRKGERLIPAVIGLMEWGDEFVADSEGPATYINHVGCGNRIHLELRCDQGHLIEHCAEFTIEHGPAFKLLTDAPS
jgi:DNA-binding HxlR family transcriptional regulator